jgi:glutamine amidotransferase
MIAIIDLGIGNVRSVMNAFKYIGVQTVLTREISELNRAKGLVLPGVGAFGEGMRRLDAHGLRHTLPKIVGAGKPLLGICLGFQMLMQSSTEQGLHEGLGLIDHQVVHLPVNARLPHIGWSRVGIPLDATPPPRLLSGLNNELFYFVHSYGVIKAAQPIIAGITSYDGCEMVAMVETGNVFGTQFHPEKSGEAGLQLLRNFERLCI